jgi:hypothetical protein
MRRAAAVLVSLALVVGLPQITILYVALFSSGWAAPIVLILWLLPVAPIFLMYFFPWRALPPVVPAAAAIVSMAVTGGLVWVFYSTD